MSILNKILISLSLVICSNLLIDNVNCQKIFTLKPARQPFTVAPKPTTTTLKPDSKPTTTTLKPDPKPNPTPIIKPCVSVNPNSSPTSDASGPTTETFETDCLKAHNFYRNNHHSPPLELDPELSRQAKLYAEELAKAGGDLVHSSQESRPGQGENLYQTSIIPGSDICGNVAADKWYDEVHLPYNYEKPGVSDNAIFKKVGHFTALVWKTTTKLGVGYATIGTKTVVVARYSPPGNLMMSDDSAFIANVLKP